MPQWERAEPVDVTRTDFTFRYPTQGLYCAEPATVMAKLANDVVYRRFDFDPPRQRVLSGDFIAVGKTGTTAPAPAIYGLSDQPVDVGPWPVDQDNSLIWWSAADDINVDPTVANPYITDVAHGAPNGFARGGASSVAYSATGMNGRPAVSMTGGYMETPVDAPMATQIAGNRRPVLFVAAVRWDAQGTADTMFCWGNSVAGQSSVLSIESTPTAAPLAYRVRRSDGTTTVNADTGVALPADGVNHVIAMLYRGRSVRFDINGVQIMNKGLNVAALNPNRFVCGRRLTAGALSQVARVTFAESVCWVGTDFSLARMEQELLPLATSYLMAKYV